MKRLKQRLPKRKLTKQKRKWDRLQRKKRYGPHWDIIRESVYKRDGYRCRACGKGREKVHKLNAHHIILLRLSKTNDIRNLITLCDKCHIELEQKALKMLKCGAHRKDIVRMTYRYLAEKRKKVLMEENNETK